MKLAVIPACGGSKRIPRKNVKDFFGQPMIAWSIAAAQDSGCFDRIAVSTDNAEIAAYPFIRAEDLRAIRINAQGRAEMFNPEHFATRSQDLEEAFHDAGQFYWGRPEAWLQGLPIFSPQSIPLRLPRNRVQDIDTLEDWVQAEQLFALQQRPPA